ncbi:hypothetical protein OS493_006451 [Desmophyllum pertusum]|uniref:Uncharacterized protein n=1 Tax=Desmophyllum pertusum TaxID=174260 RepID=A0A9X0A5L5_9CNID|nr:hypothetical protein OS493_006451 [Desmophyllum pertusum]
MLKFLENFFQSSEAQRLYRRLHVFSVSIRDQTLSNPIAFEGNFRVRDFQNVALSLLKFSKFDPSQLVRFELIDPANSSNTQGDSSLAHNTQGNDVLKYDKSNETFSSCSGSAKSLKTSYNSKQLHMFILTDIFAALELLKH